MFIIYKSNQLHILFLKICEIIQKKPLQNPFEKEILVHDNILLFKHLNMFIANEEGISANFQFFHTNDFLWKTFQKIISKKKINIYHRSIMTWNIMNIIEKKMFFKNIQKIHTPLEKFKFSFLMASLFEKYLLYRPKWMNAWEKGDHLIHLEKDEEWQRELWIELTQSIKKINRSNVHYGHVFKKILESTNNATFPKKNFSTRLFFISSFALNPMYIKILEEIGKYINIYLLHVTPCIKKIHDCHDSLMQIWGKHEKLYSLYKNSKTTKIINCFKKSSSATLLNIIQNDILESRNISHKKIKNITYHQSKLLLPTDDSISINICHHEQHEIEVLYEKLLNILKNNPDISPGDIIITSSNIEKYTAFIHTIFTSENNKTSIPFFISQKHAKYTKIVLSTFNKLFNLPTARFNNTEIIELLDIPEIADKFNISEEEIEILYYWIEKVNIRWGFNTKHQNDLLLTSNKNNTWLYGIEKLLLSYAINQKNKIWNNIISCISINGSRSELIGKIAHFVHTLNKWRKKLSRPKKFHSWALICDFLINDFFKDSMKIKQSITLIQKCWNIMIKNGSLSNYAKKVSFDIIRLNFMCIINTVHEQTFLPGVINFCHPSLVYCIPYKIICIIGANRNHFPKQKKTLDFDLLNRYSSIGDPNYHFQDSYLFLQHLSCAQKYFYISYMKHSTQHQKKIYPSIFIDQLSHYISNNFCFIGDEKKNIQNNRKKIFHHICKYHQYQHFYDVNKKKPIVFNINKNIFITNNIHKINYHTLIDFWKHPIRHYYHFSMKKKIIVQEKEIKKTEPFLIDQLNNFKINSAILNTIIHNKNIKQLFQYYELSGILPYGYFGTIFWNEQINKMNKIADVINKYRIDPKSKKFTLKIENYCIYGLLPEIQRTGLLRWKTNKINYNDRISLWLEHLIYCSLGGIYESKIIGLNNTKWSFSSLKSDVASRLLFNYLQGYLKGKKKPLWLIKSGMAWIDQVYDSKKNDITLNQTQKIKGYHKLLHYWNGDNYYKGEKNDIYIQNIISELKKNDIKKICSTAKKWLLPILKNTI